MLNRMFILRAAEILVLGLALFACARTGLGQDPAARTAEVRALDGGAEPTAPVSDASPDTERDIAELRPDDVTDAPVDDPPDVPPDADSADTPPDLETIDAPVARPEDCFNARDDDLDGLIDCDDVDDCGDEPVCRLDDPFVQVSTGQRTCAVHVSGAVSCWLSISDAETAPLRDVEKVEVGGESACALLRDGRVQCWAFLDDVVQTIPLSGPAVDVAQSPWSHACAALEDGSAWCWGAGEDGQLGDGLATSSAEPVRVLGLNDVVGVAAGTEHSCALLADGEVWCWGVNLTGRLGSGTQESSTVPGRVAGLPPASQIAAGAGHTCAVDERLGLWCWGRNNYGQLGVGSAGDRWRPEQVAVIGRGTVVTAGMFHTCAVRNDGVPYCWGYNRFGQLGNGSAVDADVPLRVAGVPSAIAIDAGWTHACALASSGLISCWGGNFERVPTLLCDDSFGLEICGCTNGIDDDGDGAVDCLDTECASNLACAGLQCVPASNVLPEFFSQRVVVQNLTRRNEESGSCVGVGRWEVVYAWTAPSAQLYTIKLVDGDAAGIWVRNARCDGREIACATDGLEVSVPASPGAPLVIAIESPADAVLSIGPTLETQCDDGEDNDRDGRTDCDDPDCRLIRPDC